MPQIDPEIAALAIELRRDDRTLSMEQALAAATAMYEELDTFAGGWTKTQKAERRQVLTAFAAEWDADIAAGVKVLVA